jgi:hypothetical protein
VVAGTTGEGAALAFVCLICVGSGSHCGAGTTVEGAALSSFRLVGMGTVSHSGGGNDR